VEAYRYQPKSSAFARFFQPDGTELEERLLDSPLDSYEQITSLLRDGRRHKGVDFKTPAGTPVRATFDGTITRKNWNFRGNGNSLEIEEAGGQHRTALYLHLSELPKSVQPGQRVKKGEVIAQSGNSGHSFAPHLHYQLMRGDQVLDPFDSHRTTRAALPTAERPLFEAAMNGLRARLTAETVAAAGR
jgi:murein DD-endopeptidase MepM/ murein hydrolase activator NlpD